jgi:hypothetical protein
MSVLHDRFVRELKLLNMAENTIKNYVSIVIKLCKLTDKLHNPVLFGTHSCKYPAGDSGTIRHPFRSLSGSFLTKTGMGAE